METSCKPHGLTCEQKLFAMAHQTVSNSQILYKEKKAKPLKQGNIKPHGSCTLYSVLCTLKSPL
jgi:hypothetical protein